MKNLADAREREQNPNPNPKLKETRGDTKETRKGLDFVSGGLGFSEFDAIILYGFREGIPGGSAVLCGDFDGNLGRCALRGEAASSPFSLYVYELGRLKIYDEGLINDFTVLKRES